MATDHVLALQAPLDDARAMINAGLEMKASH